ncbi:MAG: GyrI-like domain-containing protein [Bacteroidales bacterium]|nr:GyrI-like domain-containing protein [Bacteroidales bacterium]MDD3665696.1 GyrI-like domain-containing protein [Bacteroidales bacterium]
MEIKNIAPVLVMSKTIETTLAQMAEAVGNLPDQMNRIIEKAGGQTAGPQIWVYHSADGTPDRPITLQLTFPLLNPIACPEGYECIMLPEYKAVVTFNNGPWNEVGKIYCEVMKYIESQSLTYTGVSREIYHVCDFENQQNCVTEIQVGIEG